MAQNKNNNKNGGDCCSFCGAKRTDVEIMFQGSDGANICNKCIENGYKIIVDNDIASERGRRPAAAPLKMEELLKPAQIKEFLDQYVIGQDAANHKVAIRFDAPEVLPDVAIDPDRMRQVILNLCLNGLEAMPDGGELFLSLHPEPDALRLEIRDTGVGIAPDALPHIFDPYFTTKGQGTGLGLATVHKIMEAHGGSISVTSEPGQGAVFRLLLPLGGEGGKVHGHE